MFFILFSTWLYFNNKHITLAHILITRCVKKNCITILPISLNVVRFISTTDAVSSYLGRDVLFIDRSIDSDECDIRQLIIVRYCMTSLIIYIDCIIKNLKSQQWTLDDDISFIVRLCYCENMLYLCIHKLNISSQNKVKS